MIGGVCGANNWFAGPSVNISIVSPAERNYRPGTRSRLLITYLHDVMHEHSSPSSLIDQLTRIPAHVSVCCNISPLSLLSSDPAAQAAGDPG